MDRKEVLHLLPRVGDKLRKLPSYMTADTREKKAEPVQDCEVVEVDRRHGWYRVRYNSTGFHECFKVPEQLLGGAGF